MSRGLNLVVLYDAYAKAHPARHIKEVPQSFLSVQKYHDAGTEMLANLYEEIYNRSVGIFYCPLDQRYYILFDEKW